MLRWPPASHFSIFDWGRIELSTYAPRFFLEIMKGRGPDRIFFFFNNLNNGPILWFK